MQQLSRIQQLLNDPSLIIDEQVQSLWSDYGSIIRCKSLAKQQSYIIKVIEPGNAGTHPRGWNTSVSHQRKLKSYQVESVFYNKYAALTDKFNKVPDLIAFDHTEEFTVLIMEDLDEAGYFVRKEQGDWASLRLAIAWLAHFHARFMFNDGEDLWSQGTYWHLSTRHDEFNAMPESDFKQYAEQLDTKLNSARYQTLLHGDAKFQNLCFHHDGKHVAAVDFQYVGKGPGVKDLAYLVGSCLQQEQLVELDQLALDEYLFQLKAGLKHYKVKFDQQELEQEIRTLYPVAWADFYRFLLGWNPKSWKVCDYMKQMAQQGIKNLDNFNLNVS